MMMKMMMRLMKMMMMMMMKMMMMMMMKMMEILHIRMAREESPLGEFLLLWVQHTLYSASEANVATGGVLGIKALVVTVLTLSQGQGDAGPVVDRQVYEADLYRGCVHVDRATALTTWTS